MTEKTLNPLEPGEHTAGPAVGYEQKLDGIINRLSGRPLTPKEREVFDHELQLLRETGPVRTGMNKNDRKHGGRQKP